MMPGKVLYLAAHGGFEGSSVPLGGGAAIYNLLVREWSRTGPFQLQTVTPAIMGTKAPTARQLVQFSEREYASFCDRFREAATARALQEDPAETVILVNDVSEGPEFARLAAAGYRVATIYHVDVVAYISEIYLKGLVAPWRLTSLWRGIETSRLSAAAPSILRLIFDQQAASVACSSLLVLPSRGMRETMLRCYPQLASEKVLVLPWGCPPSEASNEDADASAVSLRNEYGIPPGAFVVVALSRISPEKGQDVLLRALIEWESRGGPGMPVWVFICGEAAFMQGARFLQQLRRLAGRLKRVRVVFPGFVTGARKLGFLKLANVYVFPSRHESYGLTLMEAMHAGLPCLAMQSDGSAETLGAGGGMIVASSGTGGGVSGFRSALEQLAGDAALRKTLSEGAAREARSRPFSLAAKLLASRLVC